MKYSNLSNFKESVLKLENFVLDEQWASILKIDIALNPELEKEFIKIINEIDVYNEDSVYFDNLIKKLRNNFFKYQKKAFKEEDAIKRWIKYRQAYFYYAIIEVITEGSIITDIILKKIKKKYGSNYLFILEKTDKIKPSILTDFKKVNNEDIIDDNYLKLYLIMKKWQDEEHIFHDKIIEPHFNKIMNDAISAIYNRYPYLDIIQGHSLLPLYILNDMSIVPLEVISRFVIAGLGNELINIFGGKTAGLAKLYALGYNVSETYAIPVGSIINNKYKREIKKLKNTRYAVRSSATTEDSSNHSFAGLFTTVLDVSKESLTNAIQDVCDSIKNDRVKSYIKRFKTNQPLMSVIIQKFAEPNYAGVWIGSKINAGKLEWVKGNGEKLVSGHVKPICEDWPRSTGLKIKNEMIGNECLALQKRLGVLADLEWCILNNELIWLQYRPVTKTVDIKQAKNNKNGVASSPGKVTGKPIFLKSPIEINKFKEGCILLTDYTDPEWVPVILKSKGIITAEGGFLSHTAIICRELSIPCITGIGYSKIDELKTCKIIEMDGSTGKIIKRKG